MAIIGQLLVRLGMDSSGFESGTKRTKKSLYDIQKDSAKAQQQMLHWAKVGAAFGVAVLAVRRLSRVLKESVNAAAEDESSRLMLVASLQEHTGATEDQIAAIDTYTSRAERMFRMTDVEARALAAQAAALKIPAEIINEVTEAAIGLGKALRVDARTAMVNLARTLQGDVTIWSRYGISVSESTDKMDVVREVMEKAAAGVVQAKDEMSGMTGALHITSMAWGDLHEEIGRTIGPEFIAISQTAIRAIDDLRIATGLLNNDMRNIRENWPLLFKSASGVAASEALYGVKRDINQLESLIEQAQKMAEEFASHRVEAVKPPVADESKTEAYARRQIQQENLKDVMLTYAALQKQREELERIDGTYQTSAAYAKAKQQIEKLTVEEFETQMVILNEIDTAKQRIAETTEEDLRLRIALMKQMDEEFQEIENAKRLRKAYSEMESTFKGTINAMIWEGQSFKDSMISVIKAIIAELLNMIIVEKAARAMAGGISDVLGGVLSGVAKGATGGGSGSEVSVPSMHEGGVVGWPRLHDGLASDEYRAILQRGETVTPKGGLRATVNIINNTGRPMRGRIEETEFDGRKFVTSVILDDLSSNGQVRQAIEGIQK